MGQAKEDLKTFMKKTEKMFDELQSKVQDLSEENGELKVENSELKIALNRVEKDMKAEISDLKKDIQKLKKENTKLKVIEDDLVRDVSFLKNPPYYHICVYNSWTNVKSSNVQFEKELYSVCNMCNGANFDLTSGVYTNGWPGTYTVTWDLIANDNAEEHEVLIYLRKNDVNIEESRHYSHYTGSSGGVGDQGILSFDSFTEC